MLEILLLGTGNAFSHQYYNTNLLVSWGNTNLLIDCGMLCPFSFHRLAIQPSIIKNIFITHTHADHVGGLEEIALSCKYAFQTRPNIYLPRNIYPSLWENSLKAGLQYTTTEHVGLDYYFEVRIVEQCFEIEGMKFEMLPTQHIGDMPSYGLLFGNIAYSSDTIFNKSWIFQILRRAKILIHDCSFTPNPVHAYYEELLTLPQVIRRHIYLIHYNDNSEEQLRFMEKQGFHYLKPLSKIKVM